MQKIILFIFVLELASIKLKSCRTIKPEMVLVKVDSVYSRTIREEPFNIFKDQMLEDYYISKYEVTVKEYRSFCKATKRKMPKEPGWGWHDDDPIVNVSVADAQDYCIWVGCRLPSEVEWEYAAIGGMKSRGFKYSGSDNIDEVAWYQGNSGNKVHKVGTKKPNELGIYDMCGNVSEWCADEGRAYEEQRKLSKLHKYDELDSLERIERQSWDDFESDSDQGWEPYPTIRGGSWLFYDVESIGCVDNFYSYPYLRESTYGIRCVKSY